MDLEISAYQKKIGEGGGMSQEEVAAVGRRWTGIYQQAKEEPLTEGMLERGGVPHVEDRVRRESAVLWEAGEVVAH